MKEKLLENFHAHISDNNRDDILWIQLTSKYDSEHILYFCVCYLQPERSSRGNLAQDFYDSLLSQMYLYSNGNPIFICGDFNGRVGSLKDFDDMIDCIPERKIVDEIKKSFGEHLINFLKDTKCCMLNGRGENVKNNFTYVSNLRKSVVDYMIVPYNELAQYKNIEIKLISDIILQNNIPLTPSISIPDHSVLMCSVQLSSMRNKPYWNNVLKLLFKVASDAKKQFLKYKGDRRTKENLKCAFKTSRKTFDKQRKNRIQTLNTSNPKEFWREIKKLGPGRTKTVIDSVILEDGSYSNDPNVILSRWKEEYSKLFSGNSEEINDEFIKQLKTLNEQWEEELCAAEAGADNIQHISDMNEPVSLEETKTALRRAKNEKAVGIDNIPNEILKNDKLTVVRIVYCMFPVRYRAIFLV
ncbi:unnamed protein product [Mytilus edulis]|uniref:Endonuclease/exonuclease/phosphatase domain-containing protein n=1 Tax=Mytilus edulis TaxID=6550 RepID=A0A8S3QCG2_MYTED|nr:unnamed protein product [Mytilus edulis]